MSVVSHVPLVQAEGPIPTSVSELLNQYGGIVGQVIAFVLGFVVVYLLGRAILVPFVRRVLDRRGFDPTVASLGENVAGVVVALLAIAVAFTVAGFGSVIAAFSVFAGAVALAVGFAMQDLLANFVAGVFILKDRPFEIGDWIEWPDGEGRVEEIDLRVTRVRTFDNEQITVPNGDLANNAVTNPVAYDKLRNKFVFGIGYEDDIDHAKEIILDEASKVEGILDDPGISVRVTELADSYVGLQTRFWIENPNRSDFVGITSELVQSVKERCDAEGIDMPYPYRQLTGGVDIEGDFETHQPEASADD
ncbi:mechanosensitive ion channel family protein [Halomicrococcus sp. NG-SE-24]|uniref:mechanosensitive ion channel family protein n=1 Tax=Halomicrococcus sp. NG-SE-24 TaxID=3436928 RepID=UPI003D9561A0